MPNKQHPSTPLTEAERTALDEAMYQIADLINIAAGDLDGCTELEQVAATREALAEAGKAITSWRRRVKRREAGQS